MKKRKYQSRFHALLAPCRVYYNPSTLWKTYENVLKRSHLNLSSKNELSFTKFW